MKKLVMVIFVALLSTSSFAATKCVPDGKGGQCCWDTDKEGPFKPISCW